jgi:hypothetical protein
MPVFKKRASQLVNEIESLVESNPIRSNWRSEVTQTSSGYTVRTWDANSYHFHQCWVNFEVEEAFDSSTVNATSCHGDCGGHGKRVRDFVLSSLKGR